MRDVGGYGCQLAEFQVSSKELEDGMGLELERAEIAKEQMRDWKVLGPFES